MSIKEFKLSRTDGDKCRATIEQNKYSLNITTMINGFQTTGMPINDTVATMLEELLHEYRALRFENKKEEMLNKIRAKQQPDKDES